MNKLHDNLLVSKQIQASDFQAIKEAGVTAIINNRPDGEEPGQLSSQEAIELAAQHGIDYHYLPMANGQPLPSDLVSNFRSVLNSNEGIVLAHCKSGMRSSFIWAMGAIADGEVTADQAIEAGQNAGIPLNNARAVLESI